MKVSYSWLKEYADFDLSVNEMSELLTDCGLEIDAVEEVESIRGGLKGLVVGKVLSCEAHPDSDHLHITAVDTGQGDPLPIVCGAANVAAGQKVIVATVGTVLYDGDKSFTIKKSKLRGADSFGMICAEDEIGVGSSHDGIMVLPPDTPVGMPAAEYFGLQSENVFEIGLTPNRSDATSHIGVARDLVALENIRKNRPIRLKYPSVEAFVPGNGKRIEIELQDPENCPRYAGLCMKNVKVQESPEWLKKRLSSVGLRPINNVVDVTNYILMETGQPMHAFDVSKIKGNKIVVRRAQEGETLVTLDGTERKLSTRNLMICNAEEPMCIAGVFGGLDAGVSDTTTEIFLESAYFNPVSIRKTAREHGLNTDASFRYERGADPEICLYALKRAALLIAETAGAEVSSEITDLYPKPIERAVACFDLAYLRQLIGAEIEAREVTDVLQALEMEVETQEAESGKPAWNIRFKVTVPANKADVSRPADIAEEFLRIYGYNRIEMSHRLSFGMREDKSAEPERVQTRISDFLSDNGFYEIMNNSLCSESYIERFGLENIVRMLNPLSKEMSIMRPTLLFGGLNSIAYNLHHKQSNLKFYEFGRTYSVVPEAKEEKDVTRRYREENHLSLLLCGNRHEEIWQEQEQAVDFFVLKSFVEKIWKSLRLHTLKCRRTDAEGPEFLYGMQINLPGDKTGVRFGQIQPALCKAFDIKPTVFYADFDWDNILKAMPKQAPLFKEVNRFPEVRRDLALLVDASAKFSQIETIARKCEKNLLREVSLFDVYQGKNLPENKKSYAVSFIFQEEDKTLTDKQIEKIMEKITAQLQKELGCSLR